MSLKAIVDSLDNVDENLQEFYEEQDGKYVLKVEGVREHPEVTALKNAYDSEKQKRSDLAKERDKYKEVADKLPDDFDADEYERLKANGEGGDDVQKKVEEARERERKRHERTIQQLTEERDSLKNNYHKTQTQTALKDALNEVNVAPHLRRAAERLWSYDAQLDEDGKVVTSDGTPLTEAIRDWSQGEEGSYFIAADGNGGGGAPGGRAGRGNGKDNPWAKDSYNMTQQAIIEKQDPDKAKRLKSEAGAA